MLSNVYNVSACGDGEGMKSWGVVSMEEDTSVWCAREIAHDPFHRCPMFIRRPVHELRHFVHRDVRPR